MRSLPSQKAATHPFRLLARASESVLPRLTIPSTMTSELNMAGMPVPRRSTSQQRRRNFGCVTEPIWAESPGWGSRVCSSASRHMNESSLTASRPPRVRPPMFRFWKSG